MRFFGELEARLMAILWARGNPTTVRELLEELKADRPIAYTTVITVVERLRAKGWVTRERSGRAYCYTPTLAEHEFSAHLMGQVLQGSSDRSAALLSFAGQLDPEEARALRAALEASPRDH
jgi:predicted transcriptional regulator